MKIHTSRSLKALASATAVLSDSAELAGRGSELLDMVPLPGSALLRRSAAEGRISLVPDLLRETLAPQKVHTPPISACTQLSCRLRAGRGGLDKRSSASKRGLKWQSMSSGVCTKKMPLTSAALQKKHLGPLKILLQHQYHEHHLPSNGYRYRAFDSPLRHVSRESHNHRGIFSLALMTREMRNPHRQIF